MLTIAAIPIAALPFAARMTVVEELVLIMPHVEPRFVDKTTDVGEHVVILMM